MKLSILDQAPISEGKTAKDTLESSIKLAQLGEKLNFERYWVAEHHDLYGFASPNPSVLLGAVGANTSTIRIGAGAVLLPYYKTFHIAETYNLLATLYPDRIDLGLGRAPGGSAEVSMALSDNYLKQVKAYAEDVDELTHFLKGSFPQTHVYNKITPSPVPTVSPVLWLLGTSEKSAQMAADKGINYCFGHFMSDMNGSDVVKSYHRQHYELHQRKGYAIVAVSVLCAPTTEEAEELALSQMVWQCQQDKQHGSPYIPSVEQAKAYRFTDKEKEKLEKMKTKTIIGNPKVVKEALMQIQEHYHADEIMVVTITHDETIKFTSYRLIKEQFEKGK